MPSLTSFQAASSLSIIYIESLFLLFSRMPWSMASAKLPSNTVTGTGSAQAAAV